MTRETALLRAAREALRLIEAGDTEGAAQVLEAALPPSLIPAAEYVAARHGRHPFLTVSSGACP